MSGEEYRRDIALTHGANINQQGGIYLQGEAYDYVTKLTVAAAYNAARDANGGLRPNISDLQRECKVSRAFVKKIERELMDGNIRHPSEIQRNRIGPVGPGSRSLDEVDAAVLMFLYLDEPSRNLSDYTEWLEAFTGTLVHESTVSRFFNHALPFKGGLCRPNLVPFDKFRPSNVARVFEFVEFVAAQNPYRLKYGDEKHLKGDAVFNRKVRRNPLTGEIPEMTITPDFSNRYNLTGFCSINPHTTQSAVWCSLNEVVNDADQFALELEYAIQSGFFTGGDILVLDNAAIHTGRNNSVLQDYLWEEYGLFLVFLPARAPELNPQELVWKQLVGELKQLDLRVCRAVGQHATAYAAIAILGNVTYEEVWQYYVHCGVIPR